MSRDEIVHDVCDRAGKELQAERGQNTFTLDELRTCVRKYHECKDGSVTPADWCYNRANDGTIKPNVTPWVKGPPLFWYDGRDAYLHIGLDWQGQCDVQHATSKKIIAEYDAGVVTWITTEEDRSFLPTDNDADYDVDDGFPEGRRIYRLHQSFERSPQLVRAKKDQALHQCGKLTCSICDFSFYNVYGDVGKDFIECHHLVPLSDLRNERRTKLTDVILVCSNCHRMLHRKRPWVHTDDELRALVVKSRSRSI